MLNIDIQIPTSIMHTWIISMELIAQEVPLARELLRKLEPRDGWDDSVFYLLSWLWQLIHRDYCCRHYGFF